MKQDIFPIGTSTGQTDRNGREITVGSINNNPDALPELEICTYVPEVAAFLWLTPDLYVGVKQQGVQALEGHSLAMLMILAKDQEQVNIIGTIETMPAVLNPTVAK